ITNDAAKRLRGHRTLHRMKGGNVHSLHLASWVSEIPGQSVSMTVKVAACTSKIAVRRQACVVKEATALPHARRFGIEPDRDTCDFRSTVQIHDAQRFLKAVEHIEPQPRFVNGQSSRPLSYIDSRSDCAVTIEHANS